MDFETVYKAYFRDVELYLMALCKDAGLAEELTAQVFFRALQELPKFRGDCDIRTWLCAIGKNCYLSHLRRTRPALSIEEINLPDASQAIEEQLMDKADAMRIHRLLHGLPEPYREVFSLRVLGQLGFAEIGSLFGKSANWACVTYHRARQRIVAEMEEVK